jgi:AraC-like DNA-binding protein
MVGSLDPDLLNRQAGYGVDPGFCFQHRDPDLLNAGLRHLLLTCWHGQQSGQAGEDGSVPLHPATQKALDILSGNTGEQDMAQLARHCGVSENHLSRLFHREVGVPIYRYRNSLRLGRFWEAYRRQGRRTLSEVIYEAGFGSYAQFYRVFKAEYAQGPRECLSEAMEPGPKPR